MDSSAPSRQCLQFPALGAKDILSVLRKLAEVDANALWQSELHLAKASDTAWRIYLPIRPVNRSGGEAGVGAFRDDVKLAYKTQADFDVGREANQGFAVSMTDLMGPLEGAILLAIQVDDHGDVALDSDEKMLVVMGTDTNVQGVVADVVRQGRDVRFGGLQTFGAHKTVGVLVFTDDAADYGMASSHLRRDDLGVSTHSMVPLGLGIARLWLEDHVLVGDGQGRKDLSVILAAARKAEILAADISDIVVLLTPPTRAAIYLHRKETTTDAPMAAVSVAHMLDPVQPFDVTSIDFRPDEDAARALSETIRTMRNRIGYRVALQPLSRDVAPGVDIEPILENIADLQLQVDQITALGAPQQRLMRFTDAQLPCMIDGLRRLPPEKLTDGSLRYAASHSAGRGEPAHYLLYDPQFTFMRIAETYWRSETDPDAMSFWLEPFVAQAQLSRPSKTHVFVPAGHFMVPSLAHFGGNIDETLRLVLGNLFDAELPLLTDVSRSAFYVFKPSRAEEFRLEMEVVDGDEFAPLHQRLNWINDYLQVRSPVAVDADRLAEVATGLYEGGVAKALHADIDADLKALDTVWADTQADIEKEARSVINVITDEMDAVSSRINDLHSYLAMANREMAGLEQVAASASAALKGLDSIGDDLSKKDRAMARARDDFERRVAAEVALAEVLVESTQKRIEMLRARIARIRDWGTS